MSAKVRQVNVKEFRRETTTLWRALLCRNGHTLNLDMCLVEQVLDCVHQGWTVSCCEHFDYQLVLIDPVESGLEIDEEAVLFSALGHWLLHPPIALLYLL